MAVGSMAVGSMAVGSMAMGRMAVGRMVVKEQSSLIGARGGDGGDVHQFGKGLLLGCKLPASSARPAVALGESLPATKVAV